MNKRRWSALCIIGLLTAGHPASAEEEKPLPKRQNNCPVMQRTPIDKTLYVDVKGKRVYVCCKGCIAQVKGNPDKYIKRLEDKGIVLEKAPDKARADDKKNPSGNK